MHHSITPSLQLSKVLMGFVSCLCLCAFVVSPAVSSAQRINLPPVTRSTWDNGVRLVLMEYHKAPTLSVTCQFPGGSAAAPADKSGVAGLTADLLRKGTVARSATQIAEEIDFLGGSLGAGAGDDRFTVSLNVLMKDVTAGLDLLADIVRRPTFPPEELERERQLSLAALQSIGEDPGSVARRVGTEVVFAGHPYGTEPTVTSIKGISRDDIAGFYRTVVVPERMTIVAVGDFKATEMTALLRTRFGDWPKSGNMLPATPPVKPGARKIVLIDKPDATQTQVRYLRTAFKRTSPDHFAAEVASTALGGGFTSRLTDEIRVNRSLTYGIGSGFAEQLAGGSFVVSTFTKIETTRALLDAVRGVLQKAVAGGITPAELAKVKKYLAGTFAIQMQTPEAIAGELAEMAFYGLPNDYLQTYIAKLTAVSLADVNHIAKTYFAPNALSIVMVAPAKSVNSQLKNLGAIETRSVETVGK